MPKLDLMNCRTQPVQQKRLFDSTEYSPLPQSGTQKLRGFIKFDSQSYRPDMIDRNKSQQLDSVDKPYKVKGVLKFPAEKPLKESYFVGNIAAQKFYCYKERMSSPLMNKILDREHDIPDDGIIQRVEAGKVPGGNWSASTSKRKPLVDPPTELGPGEYDVAKFEQSAQGGRPRVIKFNDVPTGRGDLVYEEEAVPSPTYYNPNHEYNRPRSSLGVIPFSDISRFDNEHYRLPGYTSTSGLTLGPDFDRKGGWMRPEIPVTLDFKGPRLLPAQRPVTTAKEPRPDYGDKISIATAAATTNKKYAMCFKSQAPNRASPLVTTSPELGPGTYRGADPVTFDTKFPDKPSPFFLNDREIDNDIFGDHYKTLRPRHYRSPELRRHHQNISNATELRAMSFHERLPTERRFKDADSFTDPVRKATQAFVTKQRINDIYPRFYSPPKTKT